MVISYKPCLNMGLSVVLIVSYLSFYVFKLATIFVLYWVAAVLLLTSKLVLLF